MFYYQGPVIRNYLPFSIRHTQTDSSFKSQLKTHLFSQTFQVNPRFYADYYYAFCISFAIIGENWMLKDLESSPLPS